MRKLLLVLAIVVLPVWLLAQDVPKGEMFGGYSLLHTGGQDFNSFTGQLNYNLNEKLGLTADVNGAYAGQSVSVTGLPGISGVSAHSHTYTFLFGPTYSYRELDKFVPFGHFLAGIAHGSSSAQTSILGQTTTISTSDTGFGLALGGGVDYKLNRSWAIRPVQIDYMSVNAGGGHANAFRYAVGIVYRTASTVY
jgi:opacity protein-like surface antigen